MFALARPGLLEAINPEMQALFRAVIYAFSIWVNKQTPGNMFMNLVFANGHAPAIPNSTRYSPHCLAPKLRAHVSKVLNQGGVEMISGSGTFEPPSCERPYLSVLAAAVSVWPCCVHALNFSPAPAARATRETIQH